MPNTPMNHEMPLVQKRVYSAPVLVRFGALLDMTQSGSAGSSESQELSASGMTCLITQMTNPNCASDRQIKENIVRVGEHPLGIGLYLFDYKPHLRDQWGHERQFGVMADEVETVLPAAVGRHPDGYKTVNYAMLGVDRTVH